MSWGCLANITLIKKDLFEFAMLSNSRFTLSLT